MNQQASGVEARGQGTLKLFCLLCLSTTSLRWEQPEQLSKCILLSFTEAEKLQTEQWTNEEMSDAQRKAQAKAKERKSSKSKNPKSVSEGIPTEEDKSELTNVEQDSLRWEGALEDPTAEAQRLEVYRANRRKRYMASRQAFLQNIQTGLNLDSNTSKLNTRNKPGVLI
ncbi:protein LIAT1 isoform X2 [Puntigrus tetrazona]|uniref:protein LIAT1 isoform X2 n=1 Tax=Puntigrus tetrazona TaxID=1606681 RepID=UPI001C8A3AE0|nr:protein LIAT1 isoform X2 [Puntigrus tetrazona]